MVTHFLLSVEALDRTINEHGPEILFGGGNEGFHAALRQCMAGVLSHTQMREDEIDWIEVVSNWGTPWPKGREPKPGYI